MVASEFWLVLFSVAVIGLLLSMALRRIGAKLLSRNKQKEGGDTPGEKKIA